MNRKNELLEVLTQVYNLEKTKFESKTTKELEEILKKEQKKKMNINKNPNKFWIINGMPEPDVHIPSTSAKYGTLVVASLFIVLLGFLGIFIWLGLR